MCSYSCCTRLLHTWHVLFPEGGGGICPLCCQGPSGVSCRAHIYELYCSECVAHGGGGEEEGRGGGGDSPGFIYISEGVVMTG